jgi:hypothetical protein
VLRLFITFSKHATDQMGRRNITYAQVQRVLNEGRIVRTENGVKRVEGDGIRVFVDAKSGRVITAYRIGGGGFGGR